MEILSRVERNLWQNKSKTPLIVFYDENHYGDGVTMTIARFLERHKIKGSENILFCGVSATPCTSIGCLEREIWPDMDYLENKGYNSPGVMLKMGRLEDADCLFTKNRERARDTGKSIITINENANVYRHIEQLMGARRLDGYCIIRYRVEESHVLEQHLKEKFGEKVFIKHWNMRVKGFSPNEFFNQSRPGRLTVVFVQHMARMGSTIDTKNCNFMYEFSPDSFVDTISQSFIGRACGFNGKIGHRAIVYSRKAVAYAYDLMIRSGGKEEKMKKFHDYCKRYSLRPAARASLNSRVARYKVDVLDSVRLQGSPSQALIDELVAGLMTKHVLEPGGGSKRTMSERHVTERKKGRNVFDPEKKDDNYFCGQRPGNWSVIVYDRFGVNSVIPKTWSGVIIKVAKRSTVETELKKPLIGPTDQSFHPQFRDINEDF